MSYTGAEVASFIDNINEEFARLHLAFERSFWDLKMAIQKDSTADDVEKNKEALDAFLNDADHLEACTVMLESQVPTPEQRRILEMIKKTFEVNRIADPEAERLRTEITKMEADLERKRNTMKLGYNDPNNDGTFVPASSVALSTTIRTSKDEATRKACYDGMTTIGEFIVDDFVEIVKRRNKLARRLGYDDFYAYAVMKAEGFSKEVLFEILDDLEAKTAPAQVECLERLKRLHGSEALQPWNFSQTIAGSLTEEMDPYFPFTRAVEVWTETFARLGIDYREATLRADLCDRPHKYSNGFCHWPVNAYVDPTTGKAIPSLAGLTSLAVPNQVGSGQRAIATLLHEGGHAAHMANIVQGSPLFSQERPPSSVPYAETQSMFLDALINDAAWLGRYAVSKNGETMPWDLIERKIRMTHPLRVLGVRSMLAVSYFEKALYEMSDDDLTPENVTSLAKDIENKIMERTTARPLLAIPHILSDESSCYYHGYILAEMAVHHTRRHFFEKYDGKIVDNPFIGHDLREVYWRPGNSITFLQAVENMTGKPLTADAIVAYIGADLETELNDENTEYLRAVVVGLGRTADSVDLRSLNLNLQLVHGDETIAATRDLRLAAATFAEWVDTTFPPTA